MQAFSAHPQLKLPLDLILKSKVYLTLTGQTLSCLGFLKIYCNKRAQQRKFNSENFWYIHIFWEQSYRENMPMISTVGLFCWDKFEKTTNKKCPSCQSYLNLTLPPSPSTVHVVYEWPLNIIWKGAFIFYYFFFF